MSEPERFHVTSRRVGVYAGHEDYEWFVVDQATKPYVAEWEATRQDAIERCWDLAARARRGVPIEWDAATKSFTFEEKA